MKWVPVRIAALETRDEDLIALEIAELDERRFAATEPVPVHEIEEEEIANVVFGNRSEEAFGLFLRVVLNWSRALLARTTRTSATAARPSAFPVGMKCDFAGNPGFH